MRNIVTVVLLLGLILQLNSQSLQANLTVAQYYSSIQRMEKLQKDAQNPNFNTDIESRKYQSILKDLSLINHQMINDSMQIDVLVRKAYIYNYFDSLDHAFMAYQQAFRLNDTEKRVPDSILFLPKIFAGSICYRTHRLDSAILFFKQAEDILDRYPHPLEGSERLYNWLGGILYESGNYNQAKNYFQKANSLLKKSDQYYGDLFVRYQSNIASCLTKTEKYVEADTIYNKLLGMSLNSNEIKVNKGYVNLKLGKPLVALDYLRKVKFSNELDIAVYNHMANAFISLEQYDSAKVYINKALQINTVFNQMRKTVRHGLTIQLQAEVAEHEQKFNEAIHWYHAALQEIYPAFDSINVYQNPGTFSGVLSYIELFNVLKAKGNCLNNWYQQSNDFSKLAAGIDAYRSAFALANHVERLYENDEARLFLNKIKYAIHDIPIRMCMKAYDVTHLKKYVELAYYFDQLNKASILSLNVNENTLLRKINGNHEVLDKISSLKENIARSSILAIKSNNTGQIVTLNESIRDDQIELGKLQSSLDSIPEFHNKRFTNSRPETRQLQQNLSNHNAVISYHLDPNELVILCIKADRIEAVRNDIDSVFYKQVYALKKELFLFDDLKKYNGNASANTLYNYLIKPIELYLANIHSLIIIPDDEINNLPFEALVDNKGNYLIERYDVIYQYAANLLMNRGDLHVSKPNVLGFAPFADRSGQSFDKLEYSRDEMNFNDGTKLLNEDATKTHLLYHLKHHNVIHLATHTIINDTLPENSYIIGYKPQATQDTANIYLAEIYPLNLEHSRLVILSSCETGSGKLTRGEGLMSVSRAFAYAGCPNIISSLWKANDKSTSWIIARFYDYLNQGNTLSVALRRAKLDYIHSPDIDYRYKSPDYWAHLVLTGIPEKEPAPIPIILSLAILGFLIILYFVFKIRK